MNLRRWLLFSLLATFLLLPRATALGAGVTLGQVDTFETGSEGWFRGGASPGVPRTDANVESGGPTGDYMLITANGSSGGQLGRLTIINDSQWAGNYIDAGVNALTMNVNNFGNNDLFLRLVFENPMMGPPTLIAFTSEAQKVSAGSGWSSITFNISPEHLISPAGFGPVTDALMSVTAIRLYHSEALNVPNPFFPIDPVVATLGVDNIRAAAVPEPATLLLLGTGLAGLGAAVRKRRKVKEE